MTREEFEQLVEEEFTNAIPEKFRDKIKNVAFLIEDEPSHTTRVQENLSLNETLLGLYRGVPATARGDHYGVGGTLPDTITLFQKPIEFEATQLEHSHFLQNIEMSHQEYVRKVIRDTIWHEVAHHFGYDEQQVREREGRRNTEKWYSKKMEQRVYLAPFYIIAATFIGLGDTLFLSYSHFINITPGCAIGGCEIVLNSPYSVPWGIIPLAYLGVIYYALMLVIAIALAIKPESKIIRQATLAYTTIGLLCSIGFELFQYFVIGALCMYCAISALTTLVLFCLTVWHWRSTRI
jgi:predicted Zn-dependent protease with MMP-like domain/uncharacterized membrane protein